MTLSSKTFLVYVLMLPALLVSGMFRVLHFHPLGQVGHSGAHLFCGEESGFCGEESGLGDGGHPHASSPHSCSHGCEVVTVTNHSATNHPTSNHPASDESLAGEDFSVVASIHLKSLRAVNLETHAAHCVLCQILGSHVPSIFHPMDWLEFEGRQFSTESFSESAFVSLVLAYSCRGPPS